MTEDNLRIECDHLRKLLHAEHLSTTGLKQDAEHYRLGALESANRLAKACSVIALGVRAIRRAGQNDLADVLVQLLKGIVPEEELLARPASIPPPFRGPKPVRPPEESL